MPFANWPATSGKRLMLQIVYLYLKLYNQLESYL